MEECQCFLHQGGEDIFNRVSATQDACAQPHYPESRDGITNPTSPTANPPHPLSSAAASSSSTTPADPPASPPPPNDPSTSSLPPRTATTTTRKTLPGRPKAEPNPSAANRPSSPSSATAKSLSKPPSPSSAPARTNAPTSSSRAPQPRAGASARSSRPWAQRGCLASCALRGPSVALDSGS